MHWHLSRFCVFPFLVLQQVVLHFSDSGSEDCLCLLAQQRNISATRLIFCIILPSLSSYIWMQPVENNNIRKLALNHCQMKCQQKVYASLTSNRTPPAQHPADNIWDAATESNGSSACFWVCPPPWSLGWVLLPSPWVCSVHWRRESLPLEAQYDHFTKGGRVLGM